MKISDPTAVLLTFLRGDGTLEAAKGPHWDAAVALARRERVLPAVGAELVRLGAVAPPVTVAQHLLQVGASLSAIDGPLAVHLANGARNRDLLDQLSLVRSTAERLGVTVLPLKGVAMLERITEYARELTDIDVLVIGAERATELRDALCVAGYREATSDEYQQVTLFPDDHQLTPLLMEGRPGSVELHRRVLQQEYDALFPHSLVEQETEGADTDAGHSAGSRTVAESGSEPRLSAYAMALHSIIHSRIVDNSYRRHEPALRSVIDVAELMREDPGIVPRLIAHARGSDRILRHAIHAHLMLAGLARAGMPAVRPPMAVRLWWWRVRLLQRKPQLHEHFRTAALVGFAMQRERIEHRAGRPLTWSALQWHRLRFGLTRTADHLRRPRRRLPGGATS